MSDMVFRWASRPKNAPAADVAGTYLGKLAAKNDNKMTAGLLVADARQPRSPFHGCFEWDDAKAAAEHRLYQARLILVDLECVKAEPGREDNPISVRAFPCINVDGERVFRPMTTVLAKAGEIAQIVAQAKRQLENWREKYGALKEFTRLAGIIDTVLQEVG